MLCHKDHPLAADGTMSWADIPLRDDKLREVCFECSLD